MAEPERDRRASRRQLGVREFRAYLADYLRQARQGDSFLIKSRGEVLAEIDPPAPAHCARRKPGALRGRIRMAPDFDTLPADVLAAMEGGQECSA